MDLKNVEQSPTLELMIKNWNGDFSAEHAQHIVFPFDVSKFVEQNDDLIKLIGPLEALIMRIYQGYERTKSTGVLLDRHTKKWMKDVEEMLCL